MRFFNRLRVFLISLMALLCVALALLPFVLQMSENAVDRTARHDVAWNGINGRSEFQELRHLAMSNILTPSAETAEAAALAYDIVQARLETWEHGIFGTFLARNSTRMAQFRDIVATLESVGPLIRTLEKPESATGVIEALNRIEPLVTQLATGAYIANTNEISQNAAVLRRLHWIQQSLIIALIFSGFILVLLLVMQNRLLKQAHKAEKAISAENAFLAAHDILTGLPNRASLHAALCDLRQKQDFEHPPAMLMIDLDGFKPINDTHGQHVGDQLLVSVAERLRMVLPRPEADLAARYGGDEFIILVRRTESLARLIEFAQNVLASLRDPHRIDGHNVTIDASIGISVLQEQTVDPEDLINQADVALNTAKAGGKGSALLFKPMMSAGIEARRKLEADLAEADVWHEFEPHYQPLVNLATGEIIGVEALARWMHPRRGFVSPGEFIPAAESSGRIVDIGRIMIEKACRDAMRFPKPIAVSVNLSTVQLMRMDVPHLVEDVLRRSGLPAERLKLEITESVMLHDAKGTRALVGRLQGMGVTVSLDDFGTGYSSLSYLRRFGFDELKIDRSFVSDLARDRQAMAVVQTIIALAHNLDIRVIAEGIETEDQARIIAAAGCTQGQGFLFGRPVPFLALMEQLGKPIDAHAA